MCSKNGVQVINISNLKSCQALITHESQCIPTAYLRTTKIPQHTGCLKKKCCYYFITFCSDSLQSPYHVPVRKYLPLLSKDRSHFLTAKHKKLNKEKQKPRRAHVT